MIFEVVVCGTVAKVSAADPNSIVEVSVVGPATSIQVLRHLAAAKLQKALNERKRA